MRIGEHELERDAVIVACAISAGIHGALTPAHFAEGTGIGLGFLAATIALGALAVELTHRAHPTGLAATVLVLAVLLASYAAAVTSGLPLLHPHREPVEGLALGTKAVEALGLLAAACLLARRPVLAPVHTRSKGTT